MKKDNFDEMLTEALKEYVKDEELRNIEVSKVKFSKRHEENMKKLFESVANGTFEDFDDSEDNDAFKKTNVELKNTKNIYIKHVKVAVFVLLGLLVSLAIAPTMSAWRKEELGLYGDEKDEYAWVLRNDTTEILEGSNNDFSEYMDIFGYLPEGFEVKGVKSTETYLYIDLENMEKERIVLKINQIANSSINSEDVEVKKFQINQMDIINLKNEDEDVFVWYVKNKRYILHANVNFSEVEKIIKNINYE